MKSLKAQPTTEMFFHEKKGHRIEKCQALKVFLDQLVRDGHLKEFFDQEKTRAEETKVRPNPRVDRGTEEADKTLDEEDLP